MRPLRWRGGGEEARLLGGDALDFSGYGEEVLEAGSYEPRSEAIVLQTLDGNFLIRTVSFVSR